jgi:hypothetical protein
MNPPPALNSSTRNPAILELASAASYARSRSSVVIRVSDRRVVERAISFSSSSSSAGPPRRGLPSTFSFDAADDDAAIAAMTLARRSAILRDFWARCWAADCLPSSIPPPPPPSMTRWMSLFVGALADPRTTATAEDNVAMADRDIAP